MITDDLPFADAEPRWYCLWSRTMRQFILEDDITDSDGDNCGTFAFVGAMRVFYTREEAEQAAVMKRAYYSGHVIEAVPLPASPPNLPERAPRKAQLAALRVDVELAEPGSESGEPVGTVEIRLPESPSDAAQSAAVDLAEVIRAAVGRDPRFHLGNVLTIHLGQHRAAYPFTHSLGAK